MTRLAPTVPTPTTIPSGPPARGAGGQTPDSELWSVFDARRVKAPELRGLDAAVNGIVGWFKNRRPVLARLKEQVKRIEALEPEVREMGAERFRKSVGEMRDLARRGRLVGPALDRAMAIIREGAWRAVNMRP